MSCPLSITFSYEIIVFKPKQTTAAGSSDKSQHQSPCTSSSPSPQSVGPDSSEQSLSPSTQRLQQQIRKRMTAKRESGADADSLLLLEAVDAKARRQKQEQLIRESASDADSLRVLLQATATNDGKEAPEASSKTTGRRSSWSSFDDLRMDTPCPSPKEPNTGKEVERPDSAGQEAKLGLQSEFERSMIEGRQRREASKMVQSSSQAHYRGARSVAELMGHFEELEVRDSEEATSRKSHVMKEAPNNGMS